MRRLAVLLGALAVAGVAAAQEGPSAPQAEVVMPGKVFVSGELDVLTGTTVTWRNTDAATHTVTADEDTFDSGFLRPGQTFARAFPQTGEFAYHCTIHRFMRGVVRVYAVVLRGPEQPLLAGFKTRLEGKAPAGVAEVVLERIDRAGAVETRRMALPSDGVFGFTLRANAPAVYRARAGEATSPVLRLPVAPHVSLKRDGRFLVVAAAPARPRSPVSLQAYNRELFGWVTVARGRLDRSSRARLAYTPARNAHLRAVVRGRGGWSDGISPVVAVRSS